MGTSVKMIEVHYGHVLLRKKAHEIAGKHMGSKKKAVDAEGEQQVFLKP
jgi:hypothetical protein